MEAFSLERHRMVDEQIAQRGLRDPNLLSAFEEVSRHLFVPENSWYAAYDDTPLPIGFGQTISQPYIVALMTSLLELTGDERVLEVGTGSGYQAAILSRLAAKVHTIEFLPDLAIRAETLLRELEYSNVYIHVGDGSLGWPEAAPYPAIVVTASSPKVPDPLCEQLSEGGRLVLPVESHRVQLLKVLTRRGDEFIEEVITSVAFVPLRGKYGWK
jgi:protein-L-isoaspartate(D-aspartate) O-methyltransferase